MGSKIPTTSTNPRVNAWARESQYDRIRRYRMNCNQASYRNLLKAKPYLEFAHSSRQRRVCSAERRQLNASRVSVGIKRSKIQIIENIEEVETHINFCALAQESPITQTKSFGKGHINIEVSRASENISTNGRPIGEGIRAIDRGSKNRGSGYAKNSAWTQEVCVCIIGRLGAAVGCRTEIAKISRTICLL